jgi:subtilisin-like proprotein convertase family protein
MVKTSCLLQNRRWSVQTDFKQTYTVNNAPYLSQFLQLSAQGIWRLAVVDHVVSHTGKFKSWTLALGF